MSNVRSLIRSSDMCKTYETVQVQTDRGLRSFPDPNNNAQRDEISELRKKVKELEEKINSK